MTVISATALNDLMQGAVGRCSMSARPAGDRGHIRGATFLPRRMLEPRLAELVPDLATTVVSYDEGGPRAARRRAARAGYRDARTLDGGLRAWESAGFVPVSGSNVVSKHFGEEISHSERVPQVTAQTLHEWQATGKPHVVCDIRTPGEYKIAHIPGAVARSVSTPG
jgi:rhodanese-related sulfurtransferase